MSLRNKCQSVSVLLSHLELARQRRTLAELLDKRRGELDVVHEPLVSAMSRIHTLREHGIVSESGLPDSTKATDKIVAMRRQLTDAPQDITKGQGFNLLCRAVKGLTEQCETLASDSWKEHVRTAPVVAKGLLDQHRDSPRHADTVYQVEGLSRDLKTLTKRPPLDTDTLNAIERKWEELRNLLSKLPVSDDPAVRDFLNAVISSDGAAIDLLTASVGQWLEKNNMIADFCIRRRK